MIFRHLLNMRSHPTWVRGLKLTDFEKRLKAKPVAPYVGAWIETFAQDYYVHEYVRRTLRGCVD